MYITLTCQSGLESLVRREAEKLWLTDTSGQDRLVHGTGDMQTMMRLCMGSRFANRVYIQAGTCRVTDFDTLYTAISSIDWREYVGNMQVVVEASSTRSTLSHTPTMQAVGMRAICTRVYADGHISDIRGAHTRLHILLLLIDDIVYMLVDVTGDPLHKRGYRKDAGDAPIKESLAAALVVWGGWKYKTILHDPCCGSGTIPIEAAMMARGISPGRDRTFRYMEMPGYSSVVHDRVRDELISREYTSTYQIYASDIDPDMVDIARANAVRAGVDDTIIFSVADIQDDIPGSSTRYVDTKTDTQQGTPVDASTTPTVHTISNPPYDDRMSVADIDGLYTALEGYIQQGSGGYITSLARDMDSTIWKNKKVLNGGTECRFWYM